MGNAKQAELFAAAPELPEGFLYVEDVVADEEQTQLLEQINGLTFSEIRMHGVAAKRRTIHFGYSYDFQSFELTAASAIPDFLLPIRAKAAALTQLPPHDFREALITEYQPGAGIGWHRDAPHFGTVAGISLLGACSMQFRPWVGGRDNLPAERRRGAHLVQQLAPRSAYVLTGPVREKWQHRIPSTKALRYSVTFRTIRGRRG